MFHLHTLGRIALVQTDDPERPLLADAKPLAVLAVLAAEGPMRPEQVAELVWPGVPRDRADASLRQALYRISQLAGVPLVRRGASTLSLDPGHLTSDIEAFRTALEERDWSTAIRLGGGHFLGGYEAGKDRVFVQWAERVDDWVRVNLEAAFVEAVEEALRSGDVHRAVPLARDFAHRFPLHPPAAHALAVALRAAGDASGALAELRLFGQRLQEDAHDTLPDELTDLSWELAAELHASLDEAGGEAANGNGRVAPRRGLVVASVTVVIVVAVAALGLGLAAEATKVEPIEIPAFTDRGLARIILDGRGSRVEQVHTDALVETTAQSTGVRASNVVTPGGIDTDLIGPDGTRRSLFTARADEQPLDWSPDGTRLLIHETRLRPEPPGYHRRILMWDRRSEETRVLFDDPVLDAAGHAVWSPDGAHIVADVRRVEGQLALVVVDTTGRVVARIGAGLDARSPAWSPDGERLAFVGATPGGADVFVADWKGEEIRRLAATTDREQTPIWLSGNHVAALTAGPSKKLVIRSLDGSDAVSIPLSGVGRLAASELDVWPENAERRVSALVRSLEADQKAATAAVWLKDVEIHGGTGIVSPGEYVSFRLDGTDQRNRRTSLVPPAATWTVDDSARALPRGQGTFRFIRTGKTVVRASLPGWGEDSVVVIVAAPDVRAVPELFSEDWTRPGWKDRWMPFGDPEPAVADTGAPGGGTFDNRGDENLWSGATTRDAFPLRDGLTVEVWGRAEFTPGLPYQSLEIGLTAGAPPEDPVFGPSSDEILFKVDLSGTASGISSDLSAGRLPLPAAVQRWHHYAVQIQPNGVAAVLVDGLVHVRYQMDRPLPARSRVILAGRSLNATVLHGPVTVFGGLRYRID